MEGLVQIGPGGIRASIFSVILLSLPSQVLSLTIKGKKKERKEKKPLFADLWLLRIKSEGEGGLSNLKCTWFHAGSYIN